MKLVNTMAKICHYAQEHVGDADAWDHSNLDSFMQCTSFQIACFMSQNTADGAMGVDWSIVQKELCTMPVKSIKKWERILALIVRDLGGLQNEDA